MITKTETPRAQTIVRKVSAIGGEERFCILHEAPLPTVNAFSFTCAGGACSAPGISMAQACALLIAAGISEADVYRLLAEARGDHRPHPPTK